MWITLPLRAERELPLSPRLELVRPLRVLLLRVRERLDFVPELLRRRRALLLRVFADREEPDVARAPERLVLELRDDVLRRGDDLVALAERRLVPLLEVLRAVEREPLRFALDDDAEREVADRPPRVLAMPLPRLARREVRWPRSLAAMVSRPTILLKLLRSPPAVVSCTSSARLLSSNLSKNSSQLISSRLSPPEYPGKSRRTMPTSPLPPVRRTAAGCASRSCAQRWISSRSVRTCELLEERRLP